ncbi:MAG: GPI transamidase subunit PIG-U [bacterium ADurb.Bin400]|nr:MAG: GPI transamidase subunit PIG-U [bacterium ADurb.Bin400]
MTKRVWTILILGLLLRLLIAPYTSWPREAFAWFSVTNDLLNGYRLYEFGNFSYPPLWAFVLLLVGKVVTFFSGAAALGGYVQGMVDATINNPNTIGFITSPAFNLGYKIPLILADTAIAYMLFLIARPTSLLRAEKVFAMWYLNPLVIFTSSVIGQFDVLPAALILIAITFLLEKKYFMSGLSLAIAALFKLYPVFLLPLYLVICYSSNQGERRKKAMLHLLAGLFIPIAVFVIPHLHPSIWDVLLDRSQTDLLKGGMNIWFIAQSPTIYQSLATSYLPLVYAIKYLALLAILTIPLMVRRISFDTESIITGHIAILIVTFSLYSGLANPQYYISVIMLLALQVSLSNKYRFFFWAITIGGVAHYLLLWTFAWQALLYPLAVNTSLIDLQQINNNVIHSAEIWEYWRTNPTKNVYLITSGINFLIIFVLVIKSLRQLGLTLPAVFINKGAALLNAAHFRKN